MKTTAKKLVQWDDSFYLKVYQLARSGMGPKKVASAIGITVERLSKWRKEKPALETAIQNGIKDCTTKDQQKKTFTDYVYDRLPDHLRGIGAALLCQTWDENAEKRMEQLLQGQGKIVRQHLFCQALVRFNFNQSEACRRVGIPRKRLEQWLKEDPDFIEIMDQIFQAKKDFVESALMGLVGQGDTTAIIFANKTLNHDRGYGPRTKVEHEHSGILGHAVMDVNMLPPELKQAVLDELRKARGETALPPRIMPIKQLGGGDPIKVEKVDYIPNEPELDEDEQDEDYVEDN